VPLALARVEGRIVVVHVADAQDQKISAGDVIVKVNGRPVDELYAEEAALISGATEQWIRDRALRSLLAGPVSEPLVLEIEPFAAEPGSRREVTFKRGSSPTAPKEPRPRTKEMEPGVWYVNLDGIQASDWNEVLPKLAEAKGIVLDMRGYPGMGPEFLQHMSKEPLKSAQWHTPMVLAPDRTSVEWNRRGEWNLPPKAPYLAAPRVFLLDGGAISYAESVMGIVEAYKLGAIVGEASAGTNGNINPFVTPGGYNFWWTGMKVIKHDGTRHHGVGIQPTVPVARTRAGVAAGRDEYLEKALEILKSL
jgi:C-terminal processing protease CtpA/Prc